MKQVEVLIVEDNGADRFWLEYALQNLGVNYTLSTVTDGEQAVDFLLKRGEYAAAPTPDMIFLDAHLPKADGIEVLRQVPNAKELAVCVTTNSDGQRQAFREEFGIENSNYLLKPVTQESLLSSTCCSILERRMRRAVAPRTVTPLSVRREPLSSVKGRGA